MKRGWIVLAPLLALIPFAGAAATLAVPAGASWAFGAADAEAFARPTRMLVGNAGVLSHPLALSMVEPQLVRAVGLNLLDAAQMQKDGVDTARGWLLFEKDGVVWLSVGVKDAARLIRTLEALGQGLSGRLERKLTPPRKGVVVTWAARRGKGFGAGFAVSADRALVLVAGGRKALSFEAMFTAVEKASVRKAPVEGAALAWVGEVSEAKDVWAGVVPSADGLDVAVHARAAKGVFQSAGEHAAWVSAPTGSGGDAAAASLRMRALVGRALAERMKESLAAEKDPKAARFSPLAEMLAGPVEFVLPPFDPATLADVSFDLHSVRTLLRPTVTRPASGTPVAADAAWGKPQLACEKGAPVAALRADVGDVGRALAGIGFMDAMGNDALMAAMGLSVQYGGLLRASQPVVALLCDEGEGILDGRIRWRFVPASK